MLDADARAGDHDEIVGREPEVPGGLSDDGGAVSVPDGRRVHLAWLVGCAQAVLETSEGGFGVVGELVLAASTRVCGAS